MATSHLIASVEVHLVDRWLAGPDTLDIGEEQLTCPLDIPFHVPRDVRRKDDFGVGEERVRRWERLGIRHVERNGREAAGRVQGLQQHLCNTLGHDR